MDTQEQPATEPNGLQQLIHDRTGGSATKQELAEMVKVCPEELQDEQRRKQYIENIKLGKEGLGHDYFEKFPLWKLEYETRLEPMRQELLKDIGTPTMAQSMILDLLLITYHRIISTERLFAELALAIDFMALKNTERVYKFVQDNLTELYKRLDLLMDMLDKAGGGKNKKIRIKAASFQVQVDANGLTGMDQG